MVEIPFFIGHAKSKYAADRLSDHAFLVRANDADCDPTVGDGNQARIRHIWLFFEFNSKKSHSLANSSADRGRVLADAAGEHQRVQSAQCRGKSADPFLDLVDSLVAGVFISHMLSLVGAKRA